MAEGVGLEPTSPKAPVFKTGGLPIILTLRRGPEWVLYRIDLQFSNRAFLCIVGSMFFVRGMRVLRGC